MKKIGLSIWFFIGLQLTLYGLLIMGSGLYEFLHPETQNTVLAHLHAGIWWGFVMLVLGLFYSVRFRPRH